MSEQLVVLHLLFITFLSGCSGRSDHCYLCEGLPYDGICLVDLATGSVAELAPGNDSGHMAITFCGGAAVRTLAGEYSKASIPTEICEMDPSRFCDKCLRTILSITAGGYVLADLHDLTNVKIYGIKSGASYTIRGAVVAITEDAAGRLLVRVAADTKL